MFYYTHLKKNTHTQFKFKFCRSGTESNGGDFRGSVGKKSPGPRCVCGDGSGGIGCRVESVGRSGKKRKRVSGTAQQGYKRGDFAEAVVG